MITDYISREALAAEGFIHTSDTDVVMGAVFGTVPDIIDRRLAVPEIARWLGVSNARLHRYINDHARAGMRILDKDGCLSIRQVIKIDWSKLINQKRTVGIMVGNFQGKKR